MTTVPRLDGVHHLKLPVTDLARSREWYETRLGYAVDMEFTENGELAGLGLAHPNGGPSLALRRDPERARAAAGFDYFSIGVPTKADLEQLGARLTEMGDAHAGVHFASRGWILPGTHDPDGHEVRFYTTEHHTDAAADQPLRLDNVRETEAARERAHADGSGPARERQRDSERSA